MTGFELTYDKYIAGCPEDDSSIEFTIKLADTVSVQKIKDLIRDIKELFCEDFNRVIDNSNDTCKMITCWGNVPSNDENEVKTVAEDLWKELNNFLED